MQYWKIPCPVEAIPLQILILRSKELKSHHNEEKERILHVSVLVLVSHTEKLNSVCQNTDLHACAECGFAHRIQQLLLCTSKMHYLSETMPKY